MTRGRPRDLEVSVESQRRRQIMEAVMACIADHGLERTTMRAVADMAGVSTGTLAYYFKSKKELVDAALLHASRQYMERFNNERGGSSSHAPEMLERLVERFLARDNTDASFVLQMIEVGLHNTELRGTHQEMIEAGRAMIEKSIRAGKETGVYREDVDPRLAAAMLHGVLIWWGSELIWNATSEELARDASRLAIRLLEKDRGPALFDKVGVAGLEVSTAEVMRTLLAADRHLEPEVAIQLANAFELLYNIAAGRHSAS
jgi:TetR/AcrR family transcriptional regulator, fatty acid metabolism regulator protein